MAGRLSKINQADIGARELVPPGQAGYVSHVRKFNRWKADIHPEDRITSDLIREYIQEREKDLRPSSLRTLRAALKNAVYDTFPQLRHDGRFVSSLDSEFKNIKLPKPDGRVYNEEILSDAEIEKLFIDLKYNWNNPRLALIIKTLALTGLRVSELCGIRQDDCHQEKGVVYITIIGKGSKERRIFINQQLYLDIHKHFLDLKHDQEFLFQTRRGGPYCRKYLWRIIKQAGRDNIGRELNPHMFRHSFATNQIKKRGSVKAVSNYLGHSSTAITEDMYNHDSLKPEDLF